MIKLKALKVGKPIELRACPPGLFYYGQTLCMKTEYFTHSYFDDQDYCDAYVVETGEVFYGGARTAAERDRLLVRPVEV